jgi:3-dehydroquinate dehydratase-2
MLGKRPVEHYGTFTLSELEYQVSEFAKEFEIEIAFFQTNSEGAYVERLHRAPELTDALVLNPGAWTHYSYAIRDALEICGLPAVEVHISDVTKREEWRRQSVISDLCVETISGQGIDGYRRAIEALKGRLSNGG